MKEEEVAVEKAEGKMKEAWGALTGDEAIKEEGRALQRAARAATSPNAAAIHTKSVDCRMPASLVVANFCAR